ncbi:hypothetical protein PHYPSEUDO_011397 [Phytophthora pseudosyringae]|uniref:Telomerase reverse transcriptase n=1 Tax=Phytophthora pseudosyringae TaxID=221518 RepID=A0A8T1V8I0_9STRA|nr:hypothetical protein PHYPSEUDO_011397 [Phytophthora pseudosyringae]
MEALLAQAATLRSFLRSAAEERVANGDVSLEQNLSRASTEDVAFALDHTFVIQAHSTGVQALPRPPWSCETRISQTELVHHVIERLLERKRAMDWEDANILTLGYREVTQGAAGHRVTQSNGVMCYYPNTLVAALKKPLWESLHQLMGDDLMTHLLLNSTIFVQLKKAPDSYMQLTGKSLRQQKRQGLEGSVDSVKRELSINRVMYARYFQKDRVFASSHVLVKAAKTGGPISRTEASRVIRSLFPETEGQKRLPKRLVNLIPTMQALVSRFQACEVEELAKKLTPVSAAFRKFMADNPSIKRKIAERAADVKTSSQPIILPIVRKALEDGYLSQSEGVAPSSDRKRKRREEAIETLSKSAQVEKKQRIADTGEGKKRNAHGVTGLTKLQQHKEDIKKLLAFATPKKKIYRLVRKLVAGIVPKELWGSSDTKKNWKCAKTMLRKLVFSRKFDVFSLKKCAEELQVTKVGWMNIRSNGKFCPPNEHAKRQKLFEDLLWWVVSSLVFPLLRNLFYITEAEGMANEIAYYQRPVWNVISALALDDLEGGILQPSSDQTLSSERQLATSRLRLLPKSSGVRPLMNLSTAVDQTKVSVNRSMEAVHRVLTFEMERNPKRLLGAAVRNIDEIYKRLKPLFRQISSCPRCVERRRASEDTPVAYCVAVDVERCFDTIRPRKLYQIIKKAVQEDEYLIRRHWVGHQVAPILTSSNRDEVLPSSSFFFKLERPAYPSDPKHLQVYINYEKLSSSLLQGSIPLNEAKAAQDFFVNKVISPIRQRWHALYFDPELLSEDTIHVNLFQMLIVAAHRFTILIKMLPFVNRDMRFFHECICRILKKMTKGIHRSLELGSGSDAASKATKASAQDRNRSSKLKYEAQKRQIWAIGLCAFEFTIQAKRDQVKASKAAQQKRQCQGADWQKLLNAVQAEHEEFKQRAKRTQHTASFNLEWLLRDRRNACVLKQFLQRDVE